MSGSDPARVETAVPDPAGTGPAGVADPVAGLDLTPRPGRAPILAVLAAQARLELRLTLRRADAIVVTLVIPVLALLGEGLTDVVRVDGDRLGFVVPGVLALSVLAVAFTAPAITTGYERSYGVLKRLGTSPLSVSGLLTAKTVAILAVLAGELVLLAGVGTAAGWRPHLSGVPAALGLVLLAAAACCGYALLLAGRLRAETTTGVANLVYLLLMVGGGLLFPLPAAGLRVLPSAALAEGLRAALSHGTPVPALCWNVLGLWAVTGVVAAARGFRWH